MKKSKYKVKRNKRTLRKRIRRMIALCIFITVFLFGAIVIVVSAQLYRSQAEMISGYFSMSTAQTMSSEYFLKQQKINGLEDFNEDSDTGKQWLESLHKSLQLGDAGIVMMGGVSGSDITSEIKASHLPKSGSRESIFDIRSAILLTIELNGKTIYPGKSQAAFKSIFDALVPERGAPDSATQPGVSDTLVNYFAGTYSSYDLKDSAGRVIGSVRAGINPVFMVSIYFMLAATIIITGLLSLVIGSFISRFLTLPIINPVRQLDEKIRAIAAEDYTIGAAYTIELKKPLLEMESMASSTNLIMQKMRMYNGLLQEQKDMLEKQNEELEAQNTELAESKQKIQEAQTQMIQTENMATIGQLSAAIAHEINTPIGAMNSNAQLMDVCLNMVMQCEYMKDASEVYEQVSRMKELNDVNLAACLRVADIIKSLKTFSKLDEAEFQTYDVVEGIQSVLVLTSNLWKNRVNVHEDYKGCTRIKCFPSLLNQVFMNIIVNAIQAISGKGDIYISASESESEGMLQISINDTGSGIKPEHLQKLFEPGFTTKPMGIGMGLGLSITRSIIQKHRGSITVESEVGKGSTFHINIPFHYG